MYIKANIRLEGHVNQSWELTKQDGTVEKYYAIEGNPQRDGDDERVFDYDERLGNYLVDLTYCYPRDLIWDEDSDAIDFDLDLTTGILSNLEIQRAPDYKVEQVPGKWKVTLPTY